MPDELLEATMIDGGSDWVYYIKEILPLSKAIIAVQLLFSGVSHWNACFNAMIHLYDETLRPLTLFLREILMLENGEGPIAANGGIS